MNINFDSTVIVAWWGAIIATLVLIWDIYKWKRTGPILRVRVKSNMKTTGIPMYENDTLVVIEAVNMGDRPTTITLVGTVYYKSFFDRLQKKPHQHFVHPNPILTQQLPYVLEPGKIWSGAIKQDISLEEKVKKGYLVCQLYDAYHKNPHENKITI